MGKLDFIHEDDLSVPPLTAAEKSWLRRLQRTFDACPSARLEFVTIGDASLSVVDREGARRSEMCDGDCDVDKIVLARLSPSGLVHAVSG